MTSEMHNEARHIAMSELGHMEAIETVLAMIISRLDEFYPAENGTPNLAMNLELLIRDRNAAVDTLSARMSTFNRNEVSLVSDGFLACIYRVSQQVSALSR